MKTNGELSEILDLIEKTAAILHTLDRLGGTNESAIIRGKIAGLLIKAIDELV